MQVSVALAHAGELVKKVLFIRVDMTLVTKALSRSERPWPKPETTTMHIIAREGSRIDLTHHPDFTLLHEHSGHLLCQT